MLYIAYELTKSSAGLTYGAFDAKYEDAERHEFASIGNPTEQLAKLKLTPEQLIAIVHVTDSFGKMGRIYEPHGTVRKMDVFYCIPLK